MINTHSLNKEFKALFEETLKKCHQKLEDNRLRILLSDKRKNIENILLKNIDFEILEGEYGHEDAKVFTFTFIITEQNNVEKIVKIDAFVMDDFDSLSESLFDEHGEYLIDWDYENGLQVNPIKLQYSDEFYETLEILLEFDFFSILEENLSTEINNISVVDFFTDLYYYQKEQEAQALIPFLPGVANIIQHSPNLYTVILKNGIQLRVSNMDHIKQQVKNL